MEFIKESIGPSNILLTISVNGDEFDSIKDSVRKYVISNMEIKGFRKGKVPLSLIDSKLKEQLKGYMLDKILEEGYREFLDGSDLEPIEPPVVTHYDIDDKSATVKLDMIHFPKIDLPEYEKPDYEIKSDIKEDEIEDTLNYIARKHTKSLESDKAAENNDLVILDYEATLKGESDPFIKKELQAIRLGSNEFLSAVENAVVGHKRGETFSTNVKFPSDYYDPNLQGKEATFKISLKAVKSLQVPAIDDELAKMENFNNLDELRTDIRNKISIVKERQEEEKVFYNIIRKMKDRLNIAVPQKLIDREIEIRLNDKNNSNIDNSTDTLKTEVENEIAEMFLIREIIKKEGIEVTEAEIKQYIFNSFGEKVKSFSKDELRNLFGQVEAGLRLNKLRKFILNGRTDV